VARREANVVAGHLLLDHRRGEVAQVCAANGLGEHGAVQTRFTGLADQRSRELAALLVLVHDGHHLGLHETVDHVAYRVDALGRRWFHTVSPRVGLSDYELVERGTSLIVAARA
jgi:hypothetical protein